MTPSDNLTDTCNALLRGELSAVETYTQAIRRFGTASDDYPLERIRMDHETSAASLRQRISGSGDEPDATSGAWGAFATTVAGVATFFGKSPTLTILKQGEEVGIAEYEDALEDNELDESVKGLIRGKLLPSLKWHLVELEHSRSKLAKTKAMKAPDNRAGESGKIGWVLLSLISIPVPVLVVLYVLRGCT